MKMSSNCGGQTNYVPHGLIESNTSKCVASTWSTICSSCSVPESRKSSVGFALVEEVVKQREMGKRRQGQKVGLDDDGERALDGCQHLCATRGSRRNKTTAIGWAVPRVAQGSSNPRNVARLIDLLLEPPSTQHSELKANSKRTQHNHNGRNDSRTTLW